MADYLSRHPSEYEGAVAKAEDLFNDWFTVNVLDEISPKLPRLADQRKPIKLRENEMVKRMNTSGVLTVHETVQTIKAISEVAETPINAKMAEAKDLSNSKISNVYVKANAENDRLIQKVIHLVKNSNNAIIARLPPPWRERLNYFAVDSNDSLYMDNRLVIPRDMRENVLRAIHFGHAGRDSMLREAADIWWPRNHRQIVEKARNCPDCQSAGKNLKCLKSQNEFGKLPETTEPNEEISLDFAGPFQNGNVKKKYLLVSVDNQTRWPDALFLPNPTTEKVIEFVTEYISKTGIPKRIRTDPGTAFKSEKFKQFFTERFIDHVICIVRNHRGNGKVERMIRTINERLRTKKNILVSKEKSGISNILFALRSEKGNDGKSAFEKQNGRNLNTLKSRMFEKCILGQDPKIEIEPEDFSDEADSTILVRERVRGTKLEGAFEKVRGTVVNQTGHTISILPKGSKNVTTYSKRDVANKQKAAEDQNLPSSIKTPITIKKPNEKEASKNKQKKRKVEEQNIGQPSAKAKVVNKFVNSEDSDQEEERQYKRNQNNPAVQKEAESDVQITNDIRQEEIAQTEEPTSEPPRSLKESVKWEQAGTGPSRRHIQGSKIAKRLPSVKYSFTVLENRNFLKKKFFEKITY